MRFPFSIAAAAAVAGLLPAELGADDAVIKLSRLAQIDSTHCVYAPIFPIHGC